MLKRVLLIQILLCCLFNLNAQEQSNVKLKIETGIDPSEPGLFLNVEPKVKSSENTVIGLRFGVVAYSGSNSINTIDTQVTGNNADFQYIINEKSGNGIISFVPTFDHYLNEILFLNKHFLRPYLGVGLGYYILGSYIEITQIDSANSSENEIRGSANNQVGLLFRGGIELTKLIIGLEYNLTPKADIELRNGQTIGTIDLSFIGVSLGFVIGLGKS